MLINGWYNYEESDFKKLVTSTLNEVKNLRVAVLYGPTSEEDKLYMSTKHRAEWSVYDVLNGLWKLGIDAVWLDPTEKEFVEKIKEFDAAFINVHGEFGEDGNLQGFLAYLGIPYTGSSVLSSAISADKRLTKLALAKSGLKIPNFQRISTFENDIPNIETPHILKAVNGGSSVGMDLITSSDELIKSITTLNEEGYSDLFVEPFIAGSTVTVPAINIKNEVVLLPPVVCITNNLYYDKETKLYNQEDIVEYQTLTDKTDKRLKAIHEEVRKILNTMDFEGAIRADFILEENGDLSFLEINTIPGVQTGSNLVLSAEAANIDYSSLLGIILASANNVNKLAKWTLKEKVKG